MFSTDLASVGFRSEAGAYSKLWGYFYYELRYSTSNGRDQQYNGAMLIDVGAYLEVGLKAQALKDTFSTELKLYDNKWSLWMSADKIMCWICDGARRDAGYQVEAACEGCDASGCSILYGLSGFEGRTGEAGNLQ